MEKNVLEWLDASVKECPEKTAVADDKGKMTYRELGDAAKKIGAGLVREVKPRQAVCVYMEKSCNALAAFLGIVMAGGFYVPLDPSQPPERIHMILQTLEAAAILVDDRSAKKVQECSAEIPTFGVEELLACEADAKQAELLERRRDKACDIDPLYAIFTSGSTGVPKGVIVNHRSVIDFIACFTDIFDICEQDVIGNQAPFDFDVSVKDIYSALKSHATLQIIPKTCFSFPTKLLDYLAEREVTTLIWAVSALCIVTTLKGFDYKVPPRIHKVIFSGEVMPVKHLQAWQKVYPDALFANVYGPTEITCNCTYYIVDRAFEQDETLPIGQAFPNERVFLLDENDRLIDEEMPDTPGEICVSGTAVTMGYYNDADRTKTAFMQNPLNKSYREMIYRTGDIGRYNDRGELVFLSRKDFQIKHMGHRIELGEIENAIHAVENVQRACCIYDKEAGRILAFYEGEVQKKELMHCLSSKLPKFMIPQEFIKTENMPLTKNGKINRKALAEKRF